jgi:hypothetical protein
MLKYINQLFAARTSSEFNDPVFGLLVNKGSGTWCGEILFSGRQVMLLVPGTRTKPDAAALSNAHELLPKLADLVAKALQFAAKRQQQPGWRERNSWTPRLDCNALVFVGLNYSGSSPPNFALDFFQRGDASGNCWEIHFDSSGAVELEYT